MTDAGFTVRALAILFRPAGCTCDSSGEDDSLCAYCEDAPYREAAEAKAEREDELIEEEDLWPM